MTQSETRTWFAARTRPYGEPTLCRRLEALGIPYFAPTRTEQRQWSDRVRTVDVPLIPCLVFLRATEAQATALLHDPILRFTYTRDCVSGGRLVVPDRQMAAFQQMVTLQQEGLTLLDTNLKPGDKVRVIAGDFAGIEGELIRVKGHKRVVVRLDGLFALATTYIPSEYLELI